MENIRVQVIRDQTYLKYKHFIRGLKESGVPYNGVVVVKSFRENKKEQSFEEFVIAMTN